MKKIIPIIVGISLGLTNCQEPPTYYDGKAEGFKEGLEFGEKQIEHYITQLPNWDSTKFYDWSGAYDGGTKWQMTINDLKKNYIHKDSCECR